MVQPIQYGIQAPSAFESLVSGLRLGTSLQEMQAQRALREQQALQIQQNMEQKRQQQEALNAIRSARPEDLTQEFVNRYTGLIPAEQQRLMQEQFNRYDTQRQNVLAGQYGQMAQLAFSGVDDAQANGFFDQLIAAQDSESAKKALEAERKVFLSAPDKDLYGKQKIIMLRALGEKGKDVADQVNSLNKAKTESLSSDELRKRQAEAEKAVADKEIALANASTQAERNRLEIELKREQATLAKLQQQSAGTPASVREAEWYRTATAEQKSAFDAIKAASKPVTKVEISNLEKEGTKELAGDVRTYAQQMNSAVTLAADLPRYRSAINLAFTGPFADAKLMAARVFGFREDQQSATRQVIQGLAKAALSARTLLEGQGAISNFEQEMLQKAEGGEVNWSKAELNALLNVAERAQRLKYQEGAKFLSAAREMYPNTPSVEVYARSIRPFPSIEQNRTPTPGPVVEQPPVPAAPGASPATKTRRPLGQILGQ